MTSRGSFGSYGADDTGYSSYHAGGPGSGTSRDTSNEYTRLSQAIGNNIQKISGNVQEVQRMVVHVGTQQDTETLRDRLHQVQHYTNQLAKDTGKYLKDLAHLPPPSSQSEQRQRKMQKERLMNDFTSALNNFQVVQREAAAKERDSVARARAHSGLGPDNPFDAPKRTPNLIDLASPSAPQPSVEPQQQVLQIEEDVDLDLIKEREQAIRKLESDIMDVNQIFKDLGMLVHEQGEMIDSIEANVEVAQIHVEEGTTQLSKAREYQTKARKKKCIFLIILLIVLGIIGLILGLTLGKKS